MMVLEVAIDKDLLALDRFVGPLFKDVEHCGALTSLMLRYSTHTRLKSLIDGVQDPYHRNAKRFHHEPTFLIP